jgi:DNA-binding MarR family transcriptional regulator
MDSQADAVIEASRVLVAIMARSLAEMDVSITLPQWRVLVITNRYGPLNMGAISDWMGVHPSNATRACDALVKAGLLRRSEDPDDRRRQLLQLSARGQELVDQLNRHRRDAITNVLKAIPQERREQLSSAMQEFADAAGANPEELASALGWAH